MSRPVFRALLATLVLTAAAACASPTAPAPANACGGGTVAGGSTC